MAAQVDGHVNPASMSIHDSTAADNLIQMLHTAKESTRHVSYVDLGGIAVATGIHIEIAGVGGHGYIWLA